MTSLAPHGGDALGATPGHPLLTPALSGARDLSMSCQQAMLDLAAIQRIPGLAGYWPADPAYIYQDSAGYIPASVNGVVGQMRDISNAATPVARRNLLTYSEQFDNAAWTKNQVLNFGSGSTANAILAPDETLTADKLVENSSSAARGVYLTYGVTAGVSYTLSCYAKKGERNFVWLKLSDNATNWARSFNLDTGAVGGLVTSFSAPTSSSIQAIGDGWYRCSISAVAGVTNSTSNHDIGFCAQDGVRTYQGDGTSGIYIWGAQLEVGGEATPYQKIEGGTGEVFAPGNHAYQTTTANKPYLRKTPRSGVYWLDSNTGTSALTVALGNLGTACTVARSGPDGPYFLENVTISSTYNIAPAYGFGGEVAIFNRALTASEKALITRYMRRYDTLYGSLVNASPQMRGVTANTEMVPNFGVITNFTSAWRGCSSLTSFPLLDTSAGTNFAQAWYSCSSLTTFPLLDTSAVTNFNNSWQSCSSLTSFPLLDTSSGTNFSNAWQSCLSLTSFPLLDTSAGTNFAYAWLSCSSLTSFPLLDTSAGTSFAYSWFYCSSLTSFPLLDTSSGTSFYGAWSGCSSLTTFPANFFDAWGATPVANCFLNTWENCTALTQTSLNNIVASLAVSGKAAPATGTAITLNGAPLLTTMQADSAFMTAINTLKSRNWTPTYKGTAL